MPADLLAVYRNALVAHAAAADQLAAMLADAAGSENAALLAELLEKAGFQHSALEAAANWQRLTREINALVRGGD